VSGAVAVAEGRLDALEHLGRADLAPSETFWKDATGRTSGATGSHGPVPSTSRKDTSASPAQAIPPGQAGLKARVPKKGGTATLRDSASKSRQRVSRLRPT
jgi:hypothetical protein